jgi:hypothetical protein
MQSRAKQLSQDKTFNYLFSWTFFLLLGGHDDKKVMIPTQVILRNMFTPAELRVSSWSMLNIHKNNVLI